MRQQAGTLNRTWLAVLGLLVALVGASIIAIGTGLLAFTGWSWLPERGSAFVDPDFGSLLEQPWVQVLAAVIGVVVAGLALVWLIAQVPRSNAARPYRLHDDPATGLTIIDSSVLANAVTEQVKSLPGVTNADVVLRGSAESPELSMKIDVGRRADLTRVVGLVQTEVADGLSSALDTQLALVSAEIDVVNDRQRHDRITL